MNRSSSSSAIWEAAMGDIQLQVNKANFQTWLKDTSGISFENHKFIIGVPNTFTSAWLEKRLYTLIKRTLAKITRDPEIEIAFIIHADKNGYNANPANNINAEFKLPSQRIQENNGSPSGITLGNTQNQLRLNPKYTFDNFILGESNRLAYAAALAAGESPGESYNPVLIYSKVGLGKSHLLCATAHIASQKRKNIIFITAEKFTSDLINCLKEKKLEEFRNRFRKADILIVDDIDFIRGKEFTQEGFYNTVRELRDDDRQILVTSDMPLDGIPNLNDRLRSYLSSGLAVSIKKPDMNTRISIIKSKMAQQGVSLSSDITNFIASMDMENVNQLEGYLNRITALQKANGNITLDSAKEYLLDIAVVKSNKYNSPEEIIKLVSCKLNIPLDFIRARKKRSTELNRARKLIIYLLREKYNCTYNEIGLLLGGRDHSTMLYSYDKAASLLSKDPQFKKEAEELFTYLNLPT